MPASKALPHPPSPFRLCIQAPKTYCAILCSQRLPKTLKFLTRVPCPSQLESTVASCMSPVFLVQASVTGDTWSYNCKNWKTGGQ